MESWYQRSIQTNDEHVRTCSTKWLLPCGVTSHIHTHWDSMHLTGCSIPSGSLWCWGYLMADGFFLHATTMWRITVMGGNVWGSQWGSMLHQDKIMADQHSRPLALWLYVAMWCIMCTRSSACHWMNEKSGFAFFKNNLDSQIPSHIHPLKTLTFLQGSKLGWPGASSPISSKFMYFLTSVLLTWNATKASCTCTKE